jgi:hypothetical protein
MVEKMSASHKLQEPWPAPAHTNDHETRNLLWVLHNYRLFLSPNQFVGSQRLCSNDRFCQCHDGSIATHERNGIGSFSMYFTHQFHEFQNQCTSSLFLMKQDFLAYWVHQIHAHNEVLMNANKRWNRNHKASIHFRGIPATFAILLASFECRMGRDWLFLAGILQLGIDYVRHERCGTIGPSCS